jgi:nitrate/nitrite-specific signal transduction histidine kinase
MNNDLKSHEQLLFSHETLRARLDIRDFFLKNTVREVYENIGQVLSLVRMQLAMLATDTKAAIKSVESPGNLVGQSIRDLRIMCKSFYPDAEILNEDGFVEALRDTVKILYQSEEPAITTNGLQKEIQPELKLIVFKMIQEILTLIQESGGTFISLAIDYLEYDVKITVLYNGEAIPLDKEAINDNSGLVLQERAKLIKGKLNLTCQKDGSTQIQLSYPLNSLYE